MWDDIENGDFLKYEFGIQAIEEADEYAFDFDILDPTKLIPEEQVPVIPIGKMVLNRNPDNFFAETEQVAFNPANIVPGIEAYRHLKAIAAVGEGQTLLTAAGVPTQEEGIILGATLDDVFTPLAQATGQHRVWSRGSKANMMPA